MNMRHAAEVLYDAADELQRDNDAQARDIEAQEREAIEALTTIAKAGFTTEADILASAAGLWSQWKPEGRSMVPNNYIFPF